MNGLNVGKWIIYIGVGLVLFGALIWLLTKLGIPLGKLPGDIQVKGQRYQFHFPIITSIVISLFLTFVLNVIFWIFRK